jgi:hypothetical protein
LPGSFLGGRPGVFLSGFLRFAGGLEGVEQADGTIDGAFEGGFVADELADGVGTVAIHVEGAAGEVLGAGNFGPFGDGLAVCYGFGFALLVAGSAVTVDDFDVVEAIAVDSGFMGEDAAEAPLRFGARENLPAPAFQN